MKVNFYAMMMLYIDGEVSCDDGGFKNIGLFITNDKCDMTCT